MSETRSVYKVGSVGKLTRKRFLESRSLLCFSDQRYEPPTPEEFGFLLTYTGWTQQEAANILGVTSTSNYGSSTIRKWKTPIGESNHRQIPYSAWRLALLESGIVELEFK